MRPTDNYWKGKVRQKTVGEPSDSLIETIKQKQENAAEYPQNSYCHYLARYFIRKRCISSGRQTLLWQKPQSSLWALSRAARAKIK